MKIENIIKYLEKRNLNILLSGEYNFLTVSHGWINIKDYKKLSDFNFLLVDV